MTSRRIQKANRGELRDLLQGMLVAELLAPGGLLWIALPRLQDAPVLDNQGGAFSVLNPGWGNRAVRLVEVCSELLQQGLTQLRISTLSQESDSRQFQYRLSALARQIGAADRVVCEFLPAMPSAGVLSDTAFLSGSLSLLESGPEILGEEAVWHADPEAIQAGRQALEERYGR